MYRMIYNEAGISKVNFYVPKRIAFSTLLIMLLFTYAVAQQKPALPADYGRTHVTSCIVGESNSENFRHFFLQADGTILSMKPVGLPEKVEGIDNVTAIAGGSGFILALKRDGTVWGWGSNWEHQLGNMALSKAYSRGSDRPVQVDDLENVKQISVVGNGCYALKKDGTVWSWGSGCERPSKRQKFEYAVVEQVPGITSAKYVSGAMALLEDGTVVGWGSGRLGRLGNGSKNSSDSPVPVKGLKDVVQLAAVADGAIALLKNGTVWAWGNNMHGYLGNGVTWTMQGDCSTVPVQVKNLSNVIAIDANAIYLALLKDGTVKAWGWGPTGGMGFRSDELNATPKKVPGIANVVAIKAGEGTGFAIQSNGALMGWGANLTANTFHGVSYKAIKVGVINLPK